MSKLTDKFEKDFRASQKRFKEYSAAQGAKRKKAVLAWLDQTWKSEDILSEAIQTVRKQGVTGTKAADFIKEGPVVKPLKDWKAHVAKHHDNLLDLAGFSKSAQEMHDELLARILAVERELKKSKGGLADVKIMATVKEARRTLPDLAKASDVNGSLKAHVVLYARRMQASVEAVVRDALKKADPKEFPKTLQEANRKKTTRMVKAHERKLESVCKSGHTELDNNKLDKSAGLLKLARTELSALEKLADEYTDVTKKMRKELKDAKDGKQISELIKTVVATYKDCNDTFANLDERLDEAQSKKA